MSRSSILGRIRTALAQGDPVSLPVALPDFPTYPDPVQKFRRELEAAGGIFLEGGSSAELAAALTTVVRHSGVAEIIWESREIFDKHGIEFTLRNRDAFSGSFLVFSLHVPPQIRFPLTLSSRPRQRSELAKIALSASSALFGVAETGTVVHCVRPGLGRVLPVLPPAHLAFLSRADLLMNQGQLFQKLPCAPQGSVLTLVTGPSRTADIEKTLVLGAHGPKQLFVILTA